ncbi:MAG: hypothetical protein ACYC9M_16500 [Desulfobulbaceae bacterium]
MTDDKKKKNELQIDELLKVALPNFERKSGTSKTQAVSCVNCGDICDCFGPGPGTVAYAAGAVGAAIGDQVGSNE